MKHFLQKKITSHTLHVGVIGLGYVGLPLAIAFAEAGFKVTGIDINKKRIDQANSGESYIADVSSTVLQKLLDTEQLHFTTNYGILNEVDAISICVPTPLGKTHDPNTAYIVAATQQLRTYLHPGQLIVLESTTYPGTTDEVMLPELESTGLKVGIDFFLAYSPERVDPGNLEFGTHNTPKIIGGVTQACTELAQAFYQEAIETIIPVSSARVAEMVKLLENTFRAVNIGLANEIAIICEKLHIDVWEVIDAAATKPFGFMPFFPGPGLGGHCIPVDPHYLSWKLKTLNYTTRFIELAAEINGGMPHYVVNKISEVLNDRCLSLNGATILLLGVAYKRNVSDVRESPVLEIMQTLLKYKANVVYNDEYIPSLILGDRVINSQTLSSSIIQSADCVVFTTNHSYYDIPMIVQEAVCIVDTRYATRGLTSENIFRL